METPQHNMLDGLKPHISGIISGMASLVLAGVIAFGNARANTTHATDLQVQGDQKIEQLDQQIKVLQEQVSQTTAIIAAIGQFKEDTGKRLDSIERKLDQDLRYHTGR